MGVFWPRGRRNKRRSCGKAGYEGRKFLLQRKGKRRRFWVDDGWHEVKVGCCFEFGPGKGIEVFRRTFWGYVRFRREAVVIGDGASWIDEFVEMYCLWALE